MEMIKMLLELASAKYKVIFGVFVASFILVIWESLIATPNYLLPEPAAKWAVAICLLAFGILLSLLIWNFSDFLWNKRLRPHIQRRKAIKHQLKSIEKIKKRLLEVGLHELAQLSNARTLQTRTLHLNPDSIVCINLARQGLIDPIPWPRTQQFGPNFEIKRDVWELIQEMDEFVAADSQWLNNRHDAPEIKYFIDFLPKTHPSVVAFKSRSSTDIN